MLDELEVGEGPAELLPPGHVGHGRLEAGLSEPGAAGADVEPPAVDALQGQREAPADLAKHVLRRDDDAVELDVARRDRADRQLRPLGHAVAGVALDEQRGDAARPERRVDGREDDAEVAQPGVRDVRLATREPVGAGREPLRVGGQ